MHYNHTKIQTTDYMQVKKCKMKKKTKTGPFLCLVLPFKFRLLLYISN